MSSNFVQFNFPCKDCLVLAACKDKPNDETIKHLFDAHNPRCLTIPKFPSKVAYSKGLLECWANLGVGITNNMRKTEDPQTCSETNNNIPMQYIILLGQIANLMQWVVNSTSWDEGVLRDFDHAEVKRKCKTIKF